MSPTTPHVNVASARPVVFVPPDQASPTVDPVLLTAAQVAAVLQISTRTLWRLLSGRKVPEPVRLGGAVRWRAEDIKNWIAAGCPQTSARENASRRN